MPVHGNCHRLRSGSFRVELRSIEVPGAGRVLSRSDRSLGKSRNYAPLFSSRRIAAIANPARAMRSTALPSGSTTTPMWCALACSSR